MQGRSRIDALNLGLGYDAQCLRIKGYIELLCIGIHFVLFGNSIYQTVACA